MRMKIIIAFFVQFAVFTIISTHPAADNVNNSTERLIVSLNDTNLETSTFSPGNETKDQSTLISIQAIWRHGPRTQLYTFPNDQYNPKFNKEHGEEDMEQLTKDGILQSFKLGKYLRSRYNNFLPKNYSVNEISIVSSETSRTVMTGLSVAQGLFPNVLKTNDGEIMWDPVFVNTVAQKDDNYILQVRKCNRHDKIFSDYRNSPKINTNDTLELYEYLSNHTGKVVKDYINVYELHDTIFTVQNGLFGHPVPDWAMAVSAKMFSVAALEFYGFVDSPEMMKFVAGPLLYKLVHNFNCTLRLLPTQTGPEGESEAQRCNQAKFYGFSGHDTTISPLLYLFEHYDINSPPPYNALLLFELHQLENKHFIKIFYRLNKSHIEDPPKELYLKACGNTSCEFTQFQEIYKDFIIDEGNWIKECNK